MYLIINILLYILAIFLKLGYGQEYCPKICVCDIYNELNRANCSSQKLISAQISMSIYVEILDLSENDITTIDNDSLNDLKHLTTLSLANNSIHTIELDAFAKLKKLQNLILSNNRLETFDNRIIERIHNLVSLKLDGNKFMNLENKAILKSHSLQVLDLHNSQITHIFPFLLKDLPQLKSIDLSNNLLITIAISGFVHHHKLKYINLNKNPWNCDKNMHSTLRWFNKHHIDVTIEGCSAPKSKPMFERMQEMPTEATTAAPKQYIKIDSVWRTMHSNFTYFDEICPLNNSDKACDLFESCITNFSSFYKEFHSKSIILNDNLCRSWRTSPLTIHGAFYVGLFVGILSGGTFIYLMTILVNKCRNKSSNRRLRRRNGIRCRQSRSQDSYQSPSIVFENNIRQLRPTMHRINSSPQYRSDTQNHRQQIVRRESMSFFASLFERPVRRRYYRALNTNATNLVRRLSQSRLFLNASRSNNGQTSSSTNTPSNSDTSRLIDSASDHQIVTNISSSVADDISEIHHVDEDQLSVDAFQIVIRAETPPPEYKDVVNSSVVL